MSACDSLVCWTRCREQICHFSIKSKMKDSYERAALPTLSKSNLLNTAIHPCASFKNNMEVIMEQSART